MMKKVMDESEVLENSPSAKMEIKIESSDTMDLTVTRNFLDVISSLGKTFSDAANQKFSKQDLPASPYVVFNQLDQNVVLSLEGSDFIVDDTMQQVNPVLNCLNSM